MSWIVLYLRLSPPWQSRIQTCGGIQEKSRALVFPRSFWRGKDGRSLVLKTGSIVNFPRLICRSLLEVGDRGEPTLSGLICKFIVLKNYFALLTGQCFPPEAGYRIGKKGYKYAQLQVHWTNDLKETDLYDSSGMRMYYTPNIRKYDMGTMVTGQVLLQLPPGKSEVIVTSAMNLF